MSDFTLPIGSVTEVLDYSVGISNFADGSEQRRLMHNQQLVGFQCSSPEMNSAAAYKAYRDFFIRKYGSLSSFTFTSPLDGVEYTVRFDGGMTGSGNKGGRGERVVEFGLKRVTA